MSRPFRAALYPLGWPFLVESNDRRVIELGRAAFGAYRKSPRSGRAFQMRLLRDPSLETRRAGAWPQAVYRNAEHLFTIRCADNMATADTRNHFVAGYFSEAMLADAEFFHWTFLEALPFLALTHLAFTPVHAACVVRRGRGTLLCGPPGAGKSSLAYFCGRNGYSLLGEDSVFLRRRSGPLHVCGCFSRLHFTTDARTLFPEMVQLPVSFRRNGEECLLVKPRETGIPLWTRECEAGAVVYLDRYPPGSAQPRVTPMPASEVERRLYADEREDDAAVMKAHRAAIRRLVRCGAYRIRYSTLEEALELLETIS